MTGVVENPAITPQRNRADSRVVRFEEPAPTAQQSSESSAASAASAASASASPKPGPSDPPANDNPPLPVLEPTPCLYHLGRELGVGTFSVVNEIRHIETGKWFAAKIISKTVMRGRESLVKNEIAVLERVSKGQSNVLTLVDYFETKDSLYLVTELAKGGELFDRIYSRGSLHEADAAQLMKQVTSGVAHLHANGIVHRDLKPENLLFKTSSPSSSLLICDFGLSKIVDSDNLRLLTTTVGTPSYMAPEIFTKQGHGRPVDVWALGVIAYLLLCGFTPFDRDTPAEEREAIERGEYSFTPDKFWMHVTKDAQDFIRACLQVDPQKRPTAEQCLASKFLTRTYRGQSDIMPSASEFNRNHPEIPSVLEGKAMKGAYSTPPEPEKRAPVFSAKWG